MSTWRDGNALESFTSSFVRATVATLRQDGLFDVLVDQDDPTRMIPCSLLETSDAERLTLAPGDEVLLCWTSQDQTDAVILGRLGRHEVVQGREAQPIGVEEKGHAASGDDTKPEMPDTLILEAKHSLTLRVGEGSITIREDGKILIKGKDLVSHAQRMNRIKGGAVSIN